MLRIDLLKQLPDAKIVHLVKWLHILQQTSLFYQVTKCVVCVFINYFKTQNDQLYRMWKKFIYQESPPLLVFKALK